MKFSLKSLKNANFKLRESQGFLYKLAFFRVFLRFFKKHEFIKMVYF